MGTLNDTHPDREPPGVQSGPDRGDRARLGCARFSPQVGRRRDVTRTLCTALCASAMALEGLLTAGCSNREAQGAPRMSSDVTGDVRDVKAWLLESAPKVTVTVEFVNHSDRTVAVDSFRLVWPTYEQVEKDAGVVIPANHRRPRSSTSSPRIRPSRRRLESTSWSLGCRVTSYSSRPGSGVCTCCWGSPHRRALARSNSLRMQRRAHRRISRSC